MSNPLWAASETVHDSQCDAWDTELLLTPGWSRHSDGIVRTGPDRESVESLHARIEQLESDLADTHEESATNATAADNAETALEAARDEIWDVRNQLEDLRDQMSEASLAGSSFMGGDSHEE